MSCLHYKSALLAGAALLLVSSPAFAADDFSGIGQPTATSEDSAWGVSDDGSVVVGYATTASGLRALVWRNGVLTDIGAPAGDTEAAASGISGNGQVVVGYSDASGGTDHAFKWSQGGGFVVLPSLQGNNTFASANAASHDGSVVGGTSIDAQGHFEAVIWTGTTVTGLGYLSNATVLGQPPSSNVGAISDNGLVVVGQSRDATGVFQAFSWTQGGGMVGLGFLSTSPNGQPLNAESYATGLSGDGTLAAGASRDATGHRQAVIWNLSSHTITPLGFVSSAPNGNAAQASSAADAISKDGHVVVGYSYDATGHQVAFRWTQAGGMQTVVQWLAGAGVTISPAWQEMYEATAVNADGSVVVGYGNDPNGVQQGWIARVGASGSGAITPVTYDPTLAGAADTSSLGRDIAGLELEGLHRRPLLDLADPGACAWTSGGAQEHRQLKSRQELAEVGVCGDFAGDHLRVGGAVGAAEGRQDIVTGGTARQHGTYVIGEADLSGPDHHWVASLTGVYGWWRGRISRGYDNAGAADLSTGNPDGHTWAVRAALTLPAAAHLGDFGVTPYVSVTHTETDLDGYTETGGGFPARFDAQTERSDEGRVGVRGETAITPTTTLIVTAEAFGPLSHQDHTATGTVVGLYDFSVTSHQDNGLWGRAGVEVDQKIGPASRLAVAADGAGSGHDSLWSVDLRWSVRF